MRLSSVHFNSNIFCSVDIEPTGDTPGVHEIVQLAVIPLAPDLTPSKEYRMLEIRIRPENLDVINEAKGGRMTRLVSDCILHGLERWSAVQYFRDWFNKLKLVPGKKIVPLGCNYESWDRPFLVEFFAGVQSYDEFFRSDVRDVQRTASVMNDMAEWRSEPAPFPKYALNYLASCLEVKNLNPHDAIQDAVTAAEVYRRMMGMHQFYNVTPTEFFDMKLEKFVEAYTLHVKQSGNQAMPFRQFKEAWIRSFGDIR